MLQKAIEGDFDVTLEEIRIIINKPSFRKAYRERFMEGFKKGYAQARAEHSDRAQKG